MNDASTAIGKSQDRNQRRAEVKQEDNDDEADDDRFFQQVALQRLDRVLNQSRSVISRNDFHAGRQRGALISASFCLTPLITFNAFMP